MSDETKCGLFTLLETSQQQQQVTFLVHQSFPEALSPQVTLIQTLHLQANEQRVGYFLQKTRPNVLGWCASIESTVVIHLIKSFHGKLLQRNVIHFSYNKIVQVNTTSTDLTVAGHVIDGSVFSFCRDLCELILRAPQLTLQVGESVFEGGSLLTQ